MSKLNIVILAAGKGTRMHSNKPKVLHEIGGKPILAHVIACAKALKPQKIIVVYGYGGEIVREAFTHEDIIWVNQAEQHGTGHAVQQAAPHLDEDATTLILLGDVPLLSVESCKNLLSRTEELGLLTFIKPDPTGYGRIIRNSERVITAIIEHKDASSQQREIKEVNTGIIAAENKHLISWLKRLNNNMRRRKNNPTEPCLSHEFWMRLEQEDNVRFSSVSSRPMSAQRRQNSTHANWQRLNDLRVDVCTRLGIYDPATGHLQTNRIFALDEAPNPMDGAAKGNNVEQVYGIYVVFSMPVFVFVLYSIQKLRNALRPKEYNLII